MLTNDLREDIKGIVEQECTTMAEVARTLGVPPQSVYKYIEKGGVTGGLIKICEALGYDIELRYVRKGLGVEPDMDDPSPKPGTKAWYEWKIAELQARDAKYGELIDSFTVVDNLPERAREIIEDLEWN